MKKVCSSSFAILVGLAGLGALVGCSFDLGDKADGAASGESHSTAGGPPPAAAVPGAPQASSDPMAAAPKPPPGMAMIRAIHASADAPSVDVYVKGSPAPVVTGLAYGQTSGWIAVAKGSYELELRVAPSKPTDPIVYKTGSVAVDDGAMISAIAAGLVGTIDTSASFRIVPLVEKFDTVPGGKALVRAVHAGADAPDVDLDVNNDDPSTPEVRGLARFADTGAAGVAVPAGESLAVGIARDAARVTAFTTPKLPSGGQLLLIATGLLANLPRDKAGFSILAIGPNGSVGFIKQDPVIYALHASPDAPAVDAFVGTSEIFDDLSFGEISKPIQVPPGEHRVDFFATSPGSERPDTKPAAVANTGALVAGERYLAAATGFLGNQSFQLAAYREGFDVSDDKAVLRAVHASPDAPAVDIGLLSSGEIATVLFSDLTFTRASDDRGLAANPGHTVVGVGATKSPDPVATFTIPATSGLRAFTVAAGALSPAPGQKSFRLLLVDTARSPWTATTLFPH
jgi:hypothetical protein